MIKKLFLFFLFNKNFYVNKIINQKNLYLDLRINIGKK